MRQEKVSFVKRFIHDSAIIQEASRANIRRIQLVAIALGVVNLIHIFYFWLVFSNAAEQSAQWADLIIMNHLSLMIVNGGYGVIAFILEKKKLQWTFFSRIFQAIAMFTLMIFGIFICVSDQLITSSINPLVLASIGTSILYIIPPVVSIVIYSISFVLFNILVPLTQHTPDLLAHVRVNSVTAVSAGLILSVLFWRNYSLRTRQQHIIEEQQQELEQKNRFLHGLATKDPLTGLMNRSSFITRVEEEVEVIRHTNKVASIIVLDIDHFKLINDQHGHPAGDKILSDAARLMHNALREGDIVARLGGEEFIILLPDTELLLAVEIANTLREIIEDHSFDYYSEKINITASFGVAQLIDSFSASYKEADHSLYLAKNNGRNRVEYQSRS